MRFKEFVEKSINLTYVGKMISVKMGQSPDSESYNYDNDGIPLIQGNADIKDRLSYPLRYTNNPSSKTCNPGDVLISVRAPVGTISKSNIYACIGRGIASLGNINEWLYQYFLFKESYWDKYAQGSTFACINSKDIESMIIGLPCKEEQEKVGIFLNVLDKRIQTQSKIIKDLKLLKNSISQYIFGNKSKIKQKWKPVKLAEVLHERKIYDVKESIYPHATLSKEGIYAKTDRYNRDFLVKDEEKEYKITHLNDICYNPANLKFGVICLNDFGDAIFSPIYVTYEVKSNNDPYFIAQYVTNSSFIGHIRRYEQGTVYERMAVSSEDFLKGRINLPDYETQTYISKIFKSIEDKINLEFKVLEKYKEQKKFLLSNMFI